MTGGGTTPRPGGPPFRVERDPAADAVRVRITGELDLVSEPAVVGTIEQVLVDDAAAVIVLDLSDVTFLDSAGLRALIACRNRATGQGRRMKLTVVPGPVTRLLDVAGVRGWFDYD